MSPDSRHRELVAAAARYLRRGFYPVPVPAGRKGPVLAGWQKLRLRERDLSSAFLGAGNLGLILGAPSRDLVDVDLDCPEARELADRYLPPTPAVTGRPSSPRSHRWYRCPGANSIRHQDPVTRSALVELRSTGGQTLVGPSIHPSGERYESLDGDPATVESAELAGAVSRLARAIIRLRHPHLPLPRPAEVLRPQVSSPIATDKCSVLRRASAYLGAMPPAVSGQGGHRVTYAAATALVHGFGLDPEEAMRLLSEVYNPRCQPPWSERELRHKVNDAAKQPHTRSFGWLRDKPAPRGSSAPQAPPRE